MVSGHPINLLGVRCVDRVYCNALRVVLLANRVLKALGYQIRASIFDFELLDPPGAAHGYAVRHKDAGAARQTFQEHGLTLDTTYTEKVALFVLQFLKLNRNARPLYWHTFSPAAMI